MGSRKVEHDEHNHKCIFWEIPAVGRETQRQTSAREAAQKPCLMALP